MNKSPPASKGKEIAEKEVLRITQRIQKDMFSRALAGENVYIFAMQGYSNMLQSKGELSHKAMESLPSPGASNPPNPGNIPCKMDEDVQLPVDVAMESDDHVDTGAVPQSVV